MFNVDKSHYTSNHSQTLLTSSTRPQTTFIDATKQLDILFGLEKPKCNEAKTAARNTVNQAFDQYGKQKDSDFYSAAQDFAQTFPQSSHLIGKFLETCTKLPLEKDIEWQMKFASDNEGLLGVLPTMVDTYIKSMETQLAPKTIKIEIFTNNSLFTFITKACSAVKNFFNGLAKGASQALPKPTEKTPLLKTSIHNYGTFAQTGTKQTAPSSPALPQEIKEAPQAQKNRIEIEPKRTSELDWLNG